MTTRTRLAAACVPLLLTLGACGGGEESTSDDSTSSGPPPCSDFANGEEITEELSLAGCEGEGVSVNESTRCGEGSDELLAVGPVYGFVGKPAHYLGDGEDATKSEEWATFKQECPYDSE